MTSNTIIKHRHWVGPQGNWGVVAGHTFSLLFKYGLKIHHKVLDIGCGSLRVGRLLIPYLETGNYYGEEPYAWAYNDSAEKEFGGWEFLKHKKANLHKMTEFYDFSHWNVKFDFIFAHSIWTHASQNYIGKCMKACQEVMHKDSILMASFGDADLDKKEQYKGKEDWVYPGCTWFKLDTMHRLAKDNGLNLVDVLPKKEEGIRQPPRHTWGIMKLG